MWLQGLEPPRRGPRVPCCREFFFRGEMNRIASPDRLRAEAYRWPAGVGVLNGAAPQREIGANASLWARRACRRRDVGAVGRRGSAHHRCGCTAYGSRCRKRTDQSLPRVGPPDFKITGCIGAASSSVRQTTARMSSVSDTLTAIKVPYGCCAGSSKDCGRRPFAALPDSRTEKTWMSTPWCEGWLSKAGFEGSDRIYVRREKRA